MAYDALQTPPKALAFDVFGTVVNWRKTVTDTLIASAASKISSSSRSASLTPELRRQVAEVDDKGWARFAQQWRNSYKTFVHSYKPDEDPWRDIDTHHRLSLIDLLKEWNIEGLYDDNEIEDLSKIWHFLGPWADSAAGLKMLGKQFTTSTLSNGNQSLLQDLKEHGNLDFHLLQSSGDFKAYKPHPKVYLGAAQKLGLQPGEVAMVAAHLDDLKAARECGLSTIYVERKQEEDWDLGSDQYKEARDWVDIWISGEEEGFVALAKRFGIRS